MCTQSRELAWLLLEHPAPLALMQQGTKQPTSTGPVLLVVAGVALCVDKAVGCVAAKIPKRGRYAHGNQTRKLHWD